MKYTWKKSLKTEKNPQKPIKIDPGVKEQLFRSDETWSIMGKMVILHVQYIKEIHQNKLFHSVNKIFSCTM